MLCMRDSLALLCTPAVFQRKGRSSAPLSAQVPSSSATQLAPAAMARHRCSTQALSTPLRVKSVGGGTPVSTWVCQNLDTWGGKSLC